jgi:DNA-binding GntR family transcriptional regulator
MQEPRRRTARIDGPIQPIDGASIQARVAERLREAIIRGDYAPGTALSEVTLADAFRTSRTPIREALKQLQVEGLVEIRPRVGTFVTEPSRRELVELFQVKEVLEGLAARLLAQRGMVPEIEQLEANLRESDRSVAAGDPARYAELVHEFHDLIVRGADNGKLAAHYRTLMNQLAYHRLVLTSLRRPGRPGASVHEHHEILERIIAKDEYGAETAMRDHVRASHRQLIAGLDATTHRHHDDDAA